MTVPKSLVSVNVTLSDIAGFAGVIKLRVLGGKIILGHLVGPKSNHIYHYRMKAERDVMQERRSHERKRSCSATSSEDGEGSTAEHSSL